MSAILRAAHRRLADDGAAALSLRAVARDLGMVSSAMYRYVPSRDALLTLLIVEAYESLGDAVERAEGSIERNDLPGRFATICRAVRSWALAHPNQYALVYGSPVPGYAAPDDTIGPASRVPALLLAVLRDAQLAESGTLSESDDSAVRAALAPLRGGDALSTHDVSDDLLLRGLSAWTELFGVVSFEVFGQFTNVIAGSKRARTAFFEHQMRDAAARVRIT
ncbi:MAG: TetR family transcriptional regulator [Actinobacteria bacterium]|nr:TetR family transcriptional regulator [Actinomycetota bacterium]